MCHKYDIYILFKYLKYSDHIATHLMVKPFHYDFWEETSTQYKCRTTETYKWAYVRTEARSWGKVQNSVETLQIECIKPQTVTCPPPRPPKKEKIRKYYIVSSSVQINMLIIEHAQTFKNESLHIYTHWNCT